MALTFSKMDKKLPMLGEVVSWFSLGGFSENEEEFKQKYENLNLPAYCYVKRQERSALTKALRRLEKDNILLKVSDTDKKITYRVFVESRQVNQELNEIDLDLVKSDRIIFDKDKKTIDIISKNEEVAFRIEKLNQLFQMYRSTVTGVELSAIIIRLLHYAGAVTLTTRGGTYFIPSSRLEVLDKIEELIKGSSKKLLRIGVIDSARYRVQVKEIASKEILGETREIKKEIKRLEAKSDKKDFVIENRLRKVRRLAGRVKALEESGILVDGAKSISSCRRKLKRMQSMKD